MAKLKKKEKVKLKLKNKAEKAPVFDISQETKNSILGVGSIILAVLSVLSFFDKAGQGGEIFNFVSRSLFGWGFFIIPVTFLLLGMSFFKSLSRRIYWSAVVGTVLFSLLIALNVPIYRLLNKEEEEKLVDHIVVKKGGEVVDTSKTQNQFKSQPIAKPAVASQVKPELTDKEFVIKHLKRGKWTLPPLELLHRDQDEAVTGDINASANIIKRTLGNFGIDVEMGEVSVGPTVTQFTMRPAVGVKLSKITTLNSDLSLALAAHPIRIEAPIPGKSLVGIEVPNKKVALIGLRNMFDHDDFKKSKYFLPLALGRDVSGNPVFAGLEKMPHLMIAGATGTGKSVSINTIILSMLYKHSPEVLKLILIDPKRVELTLFNDIPHLITPVITDNKKVRNIVE